MPIPLENIEPLANLFHNIYQEEAKRQGDVRHKDDYDDLPENIKEFDRVLAKFVLRKMQWLKEKHLIYECNSLCIRCHDIRSFFFDSKKDSEAICWNCLIDETFDGY